MVRRSLFVLCLLPVSAIGEESCSIGQEDASLLQVNGARGYCGGQYYGCNNQGHNIGQVSASDAMGCQQKCAAQSNCVGWTFIKDVSGFTQCWLKDSNVLCPDDGMQCNQNDQYNQYWSGFCHGGCGSGPTPTPWPTPSPTPSPTTACTSPGALGYGDKCENGPDGYFYGCCQSYLVCTRPSSGLPGGYSTCQYPAPTPAPTSGGCSGQWYYDCNNQGHNIGQVSASDAHSCQQECAAQSNCVGWTFIKDVSGFTQCWLKDSNVLCPDDGMQCNQNDQYNQYWSGFCHGGCGSGPTPTPWPTPSPTPSPTTACTSPGALGYGDKCENGPDGYFYGCCQSYLVCTRPSSGLPGGYSTCQYPAPTPAPTSGGCSGQWYYGCNNQGHNIGQVSASDANSCQQACAAHYNCVGWTFINSNDGVTTQCWLKDWSVLCPDDGMQCNQNDQYNKYWSGFCHGGCGSR